MATPTLRRSPPPPNTIIYLSMIWNILIALACGAALVALYTNETYKEEQFYNLGSNVQFFVALVIALPIVLAILGDWQLFQQKSNGRYISLALNYTFAVLSGAYLLHLWDVFIGFDAFAKALHENYQWLAGILIGYGLFWLAGRFDEDSQERMWLERIAMLIAGACLVVLLVASDLAGALIHIGGKYDEPTTWAITAVMLICSFFAYRLLGMGEHFGETTGEREAWQGWMMLSPNILGFMIFFAGPLLLSFYLSFTDAKVGQVPNVVWLRNYGEIFSLQTKMVEADDPRNAEEILSFGYDKLYEIQWGGDTLLIGAKDKLFWISLRNTIVFCLMLVPLSTIPALVLSLILNSRIPGVNFFRAIYFLPSVAAVVGTALIWRWLYDPTIGYFNYTITQLADFFGAKDPEISWLTDSSVILFSIVLLAAWQVVGFNTVLFLAGLQGIPRLLYEAAYVDGANRWQQFLYVTLPMLRPTTFFVIITTIITGLQVFNEPYALMPARPLPEAASTSVYYLYTRGFFRFEFGYASSVAWVLFALIFSVTLIQFRLSRSAAYED